MTAAGAEADAATPTAGRGRDAFRAGAPLASLQMLRGLAALAVAIAHLPPVELRLGGGSILGAWAQTGFAGVDLFFVISGFVMVWVTRPDQGRAGAVPGFLFARFARIYPLWWLVCGAVFAVSLVRPDWVWQSQEARPDVAMSFLLLPQDALPLHAVGWTLIHELWFYLVFAALLLLPARALPWALALWAAIVAGAALAAPRPVDPILALVRHPLTLEFIVGAAVGWLATRAVFPAPRVIMLAGAFWLLLAALFVGDEATTLFAREWDRVWLFGLPSALVIWGLVGLERRGWAPPLWSVRLGDWSYALYLVHVLVFVALARLAAPLSGPGVVDSLIVLPIAIAAAIAASFILHVAFERPVQTLVRRALGRSRRRA